MATDTLPGGVTALLCTLAAQAQKSPVAPVPEAVVLAMARVVAERAGENFDLIGDFAQSVLLDTQRAALEAVGASVCVVPSDLAELAGVASEDWEINASWSWGGAVLGGRPIDMANGSSRGQIAHFSVPRLNDDDSRNPIQMQKANAELALACVRFVRRLLAAQPPSGDST